MALAQRIESLRKRHAHIDSMLHEEELHLGSDDLSLRKLKSLKLFLKDEIERLTHQKVQSEQMAA